MNNHQPRKKNKEKESLVHPVLAGLVSLILPGIGHLLARAMRRGLLLIFSVVTVVGLLVWRIRLAARREEGLEAIVTKAFDLEPILLILSVLIIILYLWIVIDAYLVARRDTRGSTLGLFFLVLVVFFGLGWQIGEIDPVGLVSQAKEGGPVLARVIWPWQRAITREPELLMGVAEIQVPCTDVTLPRSEEPLGMAVLVADPICGVLSEQDGTPGTTLSLVGSGFAPNEETELWWEDPLRNTFRQRQFGEYIKVTTDANGEFQMDIIMPYRLIPPSASEDAVIWKLQARQIASVGPAQPSEELLLGIEKMIETIFLGMMATFFGIILAVPFSFLAARNLMSASWITMVVYYLNRTALNIIRSIEPLIWAVIAVVVVGLGPFAGIVALTLHTIAALGKLYSEAIESIDPGPIEAIQATGANWVQTVVYAVVPQIIPPFVSFTIYRWDINVRMSTVIGLVGGGGIGFLLIQWIRLLDYRAAGIAVWFITITVALLDFVSAEIRERFV